MTHLKIGDKVALSRDYGEYPMTPIPAGQTGVVAEITDQFIGVRMDTPDPQLAAWDGILQVGSFGDDGIMVPDLDALRIA